MKYGYSLNPNLYRMLFDVLRFNLFAVDTLRNPEPYGKMTIKEYLEQEGYSRVFIECYLIVSGCCHAFLTYAALTSQKLIHA